MTITKSANVSKAFLLLVWISASGVSVRAHALDKLDPLLQQRASNLSGHSRVIVRARDAASIRTVAVLIQQVGGTAGRELSIINALAADLPDPSLLLTDNREVQRIAADRLILGFLERTGPTVGATAVRQELAYDGSGVGVAAIDSGVTQWHDDLTAAGVSQRADEFVDLVAGREAPYDDYAHDTHVAGTIVGNGFDTRGARAGIAPAAHLVASKP